MTNSNRWENAPAPDTPLPNIGQAALLLLLLGWLFVIPIAVSAALEFAEFIPPSLTAYISVIVTGTLLVLPIVGMMALSRGQDWSHLQPFTWALLVLAVYIIVATLLRAIAPSVSYPTTWPLQSMLRLLILTPLVFGLGVLGLRQVGVPGEMVPHAMGLDRPPLAGLLATFILIPIVTIGWPITGTLGDRWQVLYIGLQALGQMLPEVIMMWGVILGIITFNFQRHKALAALFTLFIYIAFLPSLIVPNNDWSALTWLIMGMPLALMMIELRALTGSIWVGILFATVYQATPTLFTDPRVQVPLITQPWQTAAFLWLVFGTGLIALLLWGGRQVLQPRWQLSALTTAGVALLAALFCSGLWSGLWLGAGEPGTYDDDVLIILTEQADLSEASTIVDPIARREFVRDALLEIAMQTQTPIWTELDALGLTYRPFYLINMIRVEGGQAWIDELEALPNVDRVMLNPNVRPYPTEELNIGYGAPLESAGDGPDWNILQVNADQVWEMGITGEGIVIAGQDTGYAWEHPAIRARYRGVVETEGEIDHTYDWHDAWDNSPIPFDDGQHGTHTMGTMVGDDGNGNQIGIAPGATWIGCRNMRRGLGNPASYTDCMEFFLAPYPPGGDPFTDGDVTMAPHVINNSWGCPDIEGCDDGVLEPAVEALRSAGIMMVVSAGNSGPGCQSVSEPPARYDAVFSVGATGRGGFITGFSSRGPVLRSEALMKPDITAPGSNIRSSLPGGRYGLADGTSMAGPHVAGLVALLWSANPDLIGDIDETERIIRESAQPTEVMATCGLTEPAPENPDLIDQIEALANATTCACGDVAGVPNNVYGWGEIDALAAVKLALGE